MTPPRRRQLLREMERLTAERLALLQWMSGRDFTFLVDSSLLQSLETLVIASHRSLHETLLKAPWKPAAAYHWLRYENPDPVRQLQEGSRRLREQWRQHLAGELPPAVRKEIAAHLEAERNALSDAISKAGSAGYSGAK